METEVLLEKLNYRSGSLLLWNYPAYIKYVGHGAFVIYIKPECYGLMFLIPDRFGKAIVWASREFNSLTELPTKENDLFHAVYNKPLCMN